MTSPLAARLQGSGLYGTSTLTVDRPPTPAPEAPKTRLKSEQRENRYAGNCARCGTNVPAGAGTISGSKAEGWKVLHLTGECPEGQAVLPGLERPQAKPGERGGRFTAPTSIHPGIYTVETSDGHRTFRVYLQPMDEDFAPGETLLELLAGPDNTHDYKTIGFIKNGPRVNLFKRYRESGDRIAIQAANQLVADPESALVAKHCLRCNAVLSVPESIAAGLGPECIKKGW